MQPTKIVTKPQNLEKKHFGAKTKNNESEKKTIREQGTPLGKIRINSPKIGSSKNRHKSHVGWEEWMTKECWVG